MCELFVLVGTYEEFLLGYNYHSEEKEIKHIFATHSHSGSIKCIASCDHYVATGGTDDRVHIYNLKLQKEQYCLTHHESTINCLQFTPGHTHIICGSQDGVLSIVRVGNWQVEKIWDKAHKGAAILDIAVHSSGKLALTLGANSTLCTWNLVKGRCAYIINLATKSNHPQSLERVLWAPCGIIFVLYGGMYTEFWDIDKGGMINAVKHLYKVISCTWLSRDLLLVGYANGKIAVVDVRGEDIKYHDAHDTRVKAMTTQNGFIVTSSSDGNIKIWDEGLNNLSSIDSGCRITCLGTTTITKTGDRNFKTGDGFVYYYEDFDRHFNNLKEKVKEETKYIEDISKNLQPVELEDNPDKPFSCETCRWRFTTESGLQAHVRIHTGEQPYSCEVCEMKFSLKSSLHIHMRTHKGEKPFRCSVCTLKFSRKSFLESHMKRHVEKQPFNCDICGKRFNQKEHLKLHSKCHFSEQLETYFCCQICDLLLSSKASLQLHLNRHSGEKSFTCHICQNNFFDKSSLYAHFKNHNEGKSYMCDFCKLKFTYKCAFKMHVVTHTGEKYVCEICKCKFKYKSSWIVHMKIHVTGKPNVCDICKLKFSDDSSFKLHMKIHTGEKRHICSICNFEFTYKGSLKVHMRLHTGEKPYSCYICKKSFTQKGTLQVHMRCHTGERPFKCNMCGLRFSQRSILNAHVRNRHSNKLSKNKNSSSSC